MQMSDLKQTEWPPAELYAFGPSGAGFSLCFRQRRVRGSTAATPQAKAVPQETSECRSEFNKQPI